MFADLAAGRRRAFAWHTHGVTCFSEILRKQQIVQKRVHAVLGNVYAPPWATDRIVITWNEQRDMIYDT
jgi:hypothetical protein